MDDIAGTIILFTLCFAVSYWEYKRYDTYITPFCVIAWPYVIVVILINFGATHFGFFPVSLQSISFVFLSFFFFLLGGLLAQSRLGGENGELNPRIQLTDNYDGLFDLYRPFFLALAVITILAGAIQLDLSLGEVGGWAYIGTKDFKSAYGTGLLSHIMILNRLAFIFLFVDYARRRRKIVLLLLIMIFTTVLVRQVKYHVFGMLLGGYYLGIFFGYIRFSIKKLLFYSVIVFLIFNITYYIGFLAVSTDYALAEKTHKHLLNLFFAYLFGGPIGFSEVLKYIEYPLYSPKEIFAVPINIYKYIFQHKDYIDIIVHDWIPVSNNYDMFHTTNVFGPVGILYMYLGPYAALMVMFVLGVIFYSSMALSDRFKNALGLQLFYAFIMALLTLSFFDILVNRLIIYEASCYMLLIPPLYLFALKLLKRAMVHHRQVV